MNVGSKEKDRRSDITGMLITSSRGAPGPCSWTSSIDNSAHAAANVCQGLSISSYTNDYSVCAPSGLIFKKVKIAEVDIVPEKWEDKEKGRGNKR
jgi:hypothetical protein